MAVQFSQLKQIWQPIRSIGLRRFVVLGLSLLLVLWLGGVESAIGAPALATPSVAIEDGAIELEPPASTHFGLDASAISPEKISQFVQAYLQVVSLIEQRETDLQAAETESESLQMQQEIQAEALDLIAAEGLTVQEYLQLLGLANIDPEFGERVVAQLQEAVER